MQNVTAIVLIFGVPLVAIAGGILAGILKTHGQQRLMELAQRERIAAIEKGLDVSLLPSIVPETLTPRAAALRRVHGLLIGGFVSLGAGIGLSLTMLFLPAHDGGDAWSIGFVPACVGIALLVAARAVRRTID